MCIRDRFGQMRDTVELPLSVISSNLELIVNREIDLQKPVDIEALRYPVVITLYDDAYRAYNDSISSLLDVYKRQGWTEIQNSIRVGVTHSMNICSIS